MPTSLFSAASLTEPSTSLVFSQFPVIQPSLLSKRNLYFLPSSTHLPSPKPFNMVRRAHNPWDTPPQTLTTDPSSSPDPNIPLSPYFYTDIQPADPASAPNPPGLVGPDSDSDSDEPTTTITGEKYIYNGIRWCTWYLETASYTCPRPEALPMPPTSLVDPHGLIRAARANVLPTKSSPLVGNSRCYRIRPTATEARSSGPISCPRSTLAASSLQPSASDNTSHCFSTILPDTTIASPTLLSRGIRLQVVVYATRIQTIVTHEDPRAVVEFIVHNDVLAPHTVRRHCRRISVRNLEQDRACEERGISERGRDGMLFGSELAEGRRRQHGGFHNDDEAEGWAEAEVD